MPIIPASNGERQRSDRPPEEECVPYWRIVWRDYFSIAVFAACSLWVYSLPIYLLDHRIVQVSNLSTESNMGDQLPSFGGPPELSYPWIKEPIPTWACGVVVVVVPMLVITLFQLKLRSIWDFHAGLTGTLKATVSSTLIATILKHFIGGFRPHYMQVCRPDVSKIFEGTSRSQSFFTSSACTAHPHDVSRAIQGFPSGHTTSAFAAAMFLTLYLNAKLKAFADHASEFWVFIVTLMPLFLASLMGGSMYISYQHHAYEVVIGMVIGIVVGTLGYRSAYAAAFDFRYNHIPLPPFGARARFAYGIHTSNTNVTEIIYGDNSVEEHPVMWSWWTRSGPSIQEQDMGLSWLTSMRYAKETRQENMPAKLRISRVERVDS
ncbi:phosphatidic acid phosphatase type 2/haloperoxidase [Rhexocercosporidium sp. MPI-PUGE-AT-0058]|nr:phosphatidic acid phosphatase type 2/haloperoxidase [Rhexocercosporidium sp. MPI-PUGE-AT-0058]